MLWPSILFVESLEVMGEGYMVFEVASTTATNGNTGLTGARARSGDISSASSAM